MKKITTVIIVLCMYTSLQAQNVGIGTNAPTEKLHVIGNVKTDTIKINAFQFAPASANGKILTSDANGIGTWKNNNAAVKALNGLTKANDSILLGGLMQQNTVIRLNANSLDISDTGSTISTPVNQPNLPLIIALSNTPTTQSFTAVNNTNLVAAQVYVATLGGTAITMQLKDNAGTILATATNTYALAFNNWSSFLYNNIVLNAGEIYILSITSAANTQVYYDNSNPYASGSSSIGASADITFRIKAIDEKNALSVKAGRVGINNTNPVAGLDINGSIKITDGTNGIGKVLTSDINGLANWQNIASANIGAWGINGNAGTSNIHFIGTTDNKPLIFKINNQNAGYLGLTGNTYMGLNSGNINATGYGNIAIGNYALANNITNSNLVAIGDSALYNSTGGTGNTAVGSKALYTNTTGNNNTANGYQSLYSNTTAYSNVASGVRALYKNTTNSNLVAIGDSALYNNISGGIANIAVGSKALFSNTSGHDNTATGYQVLYTNISGSYNTAYGSQALYLNTGGNNTATGYQALYSNTTGSSNSAYGDEALKFNTTGDYNAAYGQVALYYNSTGDNNTAYGFGALAFNTTGNNNTASGRDALWANTNGDNNTASGYHALYLNTTGYSNVAIGINSLRNNSSASNLVAVGDSALYNSTGNNNVAIGSKALLTNTVGNRNTALGTGADVVTNGLDNTTAIGYNTTVSTSNTMSFGNINVNDWVFGIPAVTAGSHALEVGSGPGNGNGAFLTNGGVWTNASDRNKKEDFTNLNGTDILKKIAALPITQWRYIGTSEYHIGPMAQDFKAAFNLGVDDKSISTIDPGGVALAAIQQLIKENEIMRKENEILTKRVEALEKRN